MSQNDNTGDDRGSTFTFWIESEGFPKVWTQLKQWVNYDDSMGDLIREAIKMYVDVREVLEEADVEWNEEERRHHVRRYVRKGLAQEIQAN